MTAMVKVTGGGKKRESVVACVRTCVRTWRVGAAVAAALVRVFDGSPVLRVAVPVQAGTQVGRGAGGVGEHLAQLARVPQGAGVVAPAHAAREELGDVVRGGRGVRVFPFPPLACAFKKKIT